MHKNHGQYSIQVEGDLIVLALDGEFNELSVQAYAAEIKQIIEGFNGKPFLMLVDNLSLIGATPEAYDESSAHNQWLSTTSMVGKATVYPNSFLTDVDSARVKAKKYLNCQNFTDIAAAKKWLSSLNKSKQHQ